MNRYSDYSVSKYDPLSFQEIVAVPMMKRQQHDANQAKLDAYLSEINKIDPYDKHYDEAIKIKSDLAKKINDQSEQLAKEGFNNNTVPTILRTNREIQDLFSPTGKAGQINAEKQNILKLNDEYQKLGKEKGWSQETVKNHIDKALLEYNNKPVYDDKGRILKYSGPEDMANKIDYNKRLNDIATNAKMSTTELAKAIAGLSKDEASGYNIVNKNSYAYKLGDNYQAVKDAYDTLKKEMSDPTSEVYKSMKYEDRDPKSLLDILYTQAGVYKQSIRSNEYSNDINPFSSGSDKNKEPIEPASDAIYDNTTVENLNKNIKETDFSKIGSDKNPSFSGSLAQSHENKKFSTSNFKEKTGKQTYKDILEDPLSQKMYEKSYKTLIAKGVLPKTADLNDNKYAQIIGKYMQENIKIPTLGHNIIKAATTPSEQMFIGATSKKDHNEMQNSLVQDLRGDEKHPPSRMMVDLDTRKQIYLEPGQKISYVGFDSPINYVKHGFKSSSQNVAAHRAQILDSEGNFVKNVAISRTRNEQETPQFRQMYDINRGYRNAVENLGEFVPLDGKYSGSEQVKDFYLKFTEDGRFILKRKGFEEPEPISSPEFQEQMRQILAK